MAGILAESNTPAFIFDAFKLSILAAATVPLEILEPLSDVNPEPTPIKASALIVLFASNLSAMIFSPANFKFSFSHFLSQ